jgi:hypothetical protein
VAIGRHSCAPEDCEVAAEERDEIVAIGLAALTPERPLAVVMLAAEQPAKVVGTYPSYRVAGPARTRAGRQPGDPPGFAKAYAAVVCASGHWH